MTKQAEWTDGDNAKMTEYAKSVGVDEAKFTQCLADPQTQIEVDAAAQFGQDVGVPSVPAFLILDLNSQQPVANVLGAQPFAEFDQKLQAALNPPTPTPPSTTPTPVAVSPGKLASLPVGVDADGHFYRGDPNAAIKLTDFSDFQ